MNSILYCSCFRADLSSVVCRWSRNSTHGKEVRDFGDGHAAVRVDPQARRTVLASETSRSCRSCLPTSFCDRAAVLM